MPTFSEITLATITDVHNAASVIGRFCSPAPLIRSYPLESALGLADGRRVWIKDYGWTPVGSFKLLGALNWMARHADRIGDRPVVAHSSGNFASGLAFAGRAFGKKVILVMPDTAPKVKFERTRALGAEIRTYEKATDHLTGIRDAMVCELAENEDAVLASPYDDNDVIAGNGVGGLEIADELHRLGRDLSHFFCSVSGGGLLAGHALAIADQFPEAKIIASEPELADDFSRSLKAGERVRVEQPESICDGLLSYDVGHHNWPILQKLVHACVTVSDPQTRKAMQFMDHHHGLRTEPSGAISIAAMLAESYDRAGEGDLVVVVSGRNVDPEFYEDCLRASRK